MAIRTVTAEPLRRMLGGRLAPRLLDVRSREEFAHDHLPAARNIPIEDLEQGLAELDPMVDLVVVSEHGIRSLRACERLLARGFLKVVNLIGGLSAYHSSGD